MKIIGEILFKMLFTRISYWNENTVKKLLQRILNVQTVSYQSLSLSLIVRLDVWRQSKKIAHLATKNGNENTTITINCIEREIDMILFLHLKRIEAVSTFWHYFFCFLSLSLSFRISLNVCETFTVNLCTFKMH